MAQTLTTADTFSGFDAFLGTRDARKVSHNTYAERRADGSIAVRLHATDIMTFHADDTITLNSGGWRTVTTKDRVNAFLPAPLCVYSVDGVWCLQRRGNAPGIVSEFYDGMRFDRHGDMVTDVLTDSGRADKRLKREIGKYVALYTDYRIAELVKDAAEHGTAGDCFMCQARGAMGTDHLLSHIEEGYTMATLAAHAVQRAGYPHPGLILQVHPGMVRRSIRKYLVESLTLHGSRPERDGNAQHWAGAR